MNQNNNLESIVKHEPTKKKIGLVDTASNITYSLVVGGILDYCSGLNFFGILASRISGTITNTITGGPYGWWREKIYQTTKTTEESSGIRKTLSDLLAFNTFQVPVYMMSLAIGSLISESRIDMDKVSSGSGYLILISPILGPTLGWYSDKVRTLFGINKAAEGNYK